MRALVAEVERHQPADERAGLVCQRADGGTITVLGSGDMVRSLAANDLVDEYRLSVYPITLGGGKRLFADDGAMRRLDLVESIPTSKGGLLLTYRPQR